MISIIAAIAKNRVIGKDNKLPWRLPADLSRFKRLTLGKPIIMGQKTFESLGRPLPDRTNIVLSLDKKFKPKGCLVANSIKEAIRIAENSTKEDNEIMICGGASVYRQFLPLSDRMYLTLIDSDFEGDAFFPEFDWSEWREIERIDNPVDERNNFKYTFITLERINVSKVL